MFIKATAAQIRFMFKQTSTVIIFGILTAMMLTNYITNVMMFQGSDVVEMYQPMKLLLLSWNRTIIGGDLLLMFVQLYPLLVVCPAGFSLAKERQTGEDILLAARMGNLPYRFSKLLAAFCVTAIVFSLPFLIEIVLNCLSFPMQAQGDLSNWKYYSADYLQSVHNYLFANLFLRSPYLYAVIGTLLFGIYSGILGAFTVALSSMFKFKYRIFLFLPVFILLNITVILSNYTSDFQTVWYHYFLLFNDELKNAIVLVLMMAVLIGFTVFGIYRGGRKDCIQ